jgi:hypothetical protein
MKKVLSFFIALALALPALAQQTNVFPEDGKVGIGTTDPTENLDINGNIRIRNLQGTQNRYAIIGPDGVIRDGQLVEGPVSPGGGNGGNGGNNTQGASWNLNGNATNGSHFLGTTNNMPLIFRTNGSQKMVLTSDGKLGLGVTNPVQAFEVAGTIKADALIISGSSTQKFTFLHVEEKLKVGNSIWLNGKVTGGDDPSNPTGYDEITTTNGKLVFAKTGANNEGDYNVPIYLGIGTTNPQRPMHIVTRQSNMLPGQGLRLEGVFAASPEFPNDSRPIWDIAPIGDGALNFSTPNAIVCKMTNLEVEFNGRIINKGIVHFGDIFRTHTNGRVGIGSRETPWGKLQVFETVQNAPGIIVGDTNLRSIWMVPNMGVAGFNWLSNEGDLGIIFRNQHLNTGQSGFVIAPHGATNAGIKINANGNVGIGVVNPDSKLQIRVIHDEDRALSILNGSGEQFLITGDGKFYARACKIKLGNFPDYVFEKDYIRMTPEEKNKYFSDYKRLPYMPSAKEIEQNGLDMGEGIIGITRNVEEMALDVNELFLKIKLLESELTKLKKQCETK